jgi:Uma2 family endonuclease
MLTADQVGPETIRPLSRSEYDRLVTSGAFDDERIELLYGTLVSMSPQDPAHARAIQDLAESLFHAIGGRARVLVQLPLAASGDSEPEPDVAVVPLGDYGEAHPDRALLVVEVAASSLRKDREVKGRLYAEMAVPEYWVVNVADRILERYTGPTGGKYAHVERLTAASSVSLKAFPDMILPLAQLLR